MHPETKRVGLSSIAKKFLPALFYILLILFLIFYLEGIDFSKFKSAHFEWSFAIAALVTGLVERYWQVFIWLTLLKGLGATGLRGSAGQLTYVYAKSWMGRYIPGTAPWILGKIYFASKHGISKNKLAVSSLLEGALQIAVVMAVAFVLLIFNTRLNVISTEFKIVMAVILACCIISILPPVFNRLISLAYKLLRHKNLEREHLANSKMIAKGTVLYAAAALLSGVSFFLVAKAIDPHLNLHNFAFVMGAGDLAAAVGMLAIFAPSGIGVREGVQLILLSAIMSKEFAILVTVTTRLWGVVLDFIFFGLSKYIQTVSTNQWDGKVRNQGDN